MTTKRDTPNVEPSRRDFLTTVAAAGGAMVLGFHLPPKGAQAGPIANQPWYRDTMVPEINAWLTIASDDTVTIRVAQTEMGSGVFTSCPMSFVDHTDEINSIYALVPIIVYCFHKGNDHLTELEIGKIVKWFYYSQVR